MNGHMEVIQYLITELGCHPALPDKDNDMPIHESCRGGQLSVVKYLITEQHCASRVNYLVFRHTVRCKDAWEDARDVLSALVPTHNFC